MKIGEFARRFSTNINTIRYYVNNGLLVPETRNKQYRFNEQTIEDMKLIIRLKQFRFSIGQIHEILSLTRVSNLTAHDDILDYAAILEEKKVFLNTELNTLQLSIKELENYIENIRKLCDTHTARVRKTGVPLEALQFLCCPHCESTLNFSDTSIENGQIINANVACACGYKASIVNGIFITEGRQISEYDFPDLDRKFYKDLPASWMTLFQRSYNWVYNKMRTVDLKGKVVLENHINCYFFLYTVLAKLDPGAIYIVSDKYPEVVTLYKELIENQNLGLKILFLADSTFHYPLRRGCVDLYIDYCAMNEYSIFDTKTDLLDIVHPFCKHDADILGTYFYFDPRSASHRKLLHEYPVCRTDNYLLSHFEECTRRNALSMLDSELNGYVTEVGSKNRNFTFHVGGDRLYLHSYHLQT